MIAHAESQKFFEIKCDTKYTFKSIWKYVVNKTINDLSKTLL